MSAAAAPSEDKSRRVTRFDAPGVNYKAKLIGLEDVTDPRGDKMCQVAMAKLKAAVVAMGEHKQRMIVNVSLEGIKLIDEKSENVLHSHPVHRISFISRDTNDSRAFGYVYNREDGVHQFCGIKTEKAAEPLVTCLKDLFLTVVELKKEKEKENVKNGNAVNITAIEIKDKITEEVEVEKNPVSNDLLGLEGSVAGVQQGIGQMNVFSTSSPTSPDSSSAWLNNSLFQNAPTQNVTSLQASALHLPQGSVIHGNPYLPQGMVAPPVYQLPSYPQQQPFTSYNPSFPPQRPSGGVAVVGAVGMHTAWPPQPGPPSSAGNLQGVRPPSNPSWMSFDSSTQLSNMFGDMSSQGGGSPQAMPMQPTSAHPPPPSNDPFAPPAKFPDPFADLAVLPSQTAAQPGQKASKGDFNKEPPKPTLLDISAQQQRQQPPVELTTGAGGGDPFATVSLRRNVSPFSSNPFHVQETQSFHSTPFAPNPAPPQGTVDKSRATYPPAAPGGGFSEVPPYPSPSGADFADLASSQVFRPRPKSNAGTVKTAALVLPLNPKVKQSMLCTKPTIKHLHDERLQRNNNDCNINNNNNIVIGCKTITDNLPASDVNQLNNPTLTLTCLHKCDSAENAAKSFDDLWLLSEAHSDRLNSSEESIWCWESNSDESGKTREDLEKREQDKHLKFNVFNSSPVKQNSTTTAAADNQNLDMGEIRDQSFENCPTSTEMLTDCCTPNVSLTKKEKHLNVNDMNPNLVVPGRSNVGPPIVDQTHFTVTPADSSQNGSSGLPASNTPEKLTLASLARRSSARRTSSLQGLVTIREENDLLHPSSQPSVSADDSDKNLLRTPSFPKRHMLKYEIGAGNCTQNATENNASRRETCLRLNPFADVDPFVTDAFAIGDPFDDPNGRLVCNDTCGFFDILQVDSTPFCTRAVTVDSNTNRSNRAC